MIRTSRLSLKIGLKRGTDFLLVNHAQDARATLDMAAGLFVMMA